MGLHVSLHVVGVAGGKTTQRARVQLQPAVFGAGFLGAGPLCVHLSTSILDAVHVAFTASAEVLVLIQKFIAASAGDVDRKGGSASVIRSLVFRVVEVLGRTVEVIGVTVHAEGAEGGAHFVSQLEAWQVNVICQEQATIV